ncbi:PL29 family lyase N-terminal domain-containing protein [uncultured Phocaeicola sp.]|uniref:PL29 family lyase N-terminal domain-containing protein n=1 Tax=uncultured Phocaeicola sp. TaxID=990718 RepID=UPI0025DDBF5D|nr:PL29 family lyase N-terminal domain-containing protein [uncultured Phocaeicola sp.]
MRKKYLSALLFGALLFASAGTFTSCKDYDDDINNLQSQIDANAKGIEELKGLVSTGDYVTNVEKTAEGLVVTFKEAGSKTIALGDQVGSVVEVKDGVLYIDGEATEIKVAETTPDGEATKAPVKIDGGFWAVLNEEGEYEKTNIPVSGVSLAGDEQTGFTLTVTNADGTQATVDLPSAASSLVDLVLPNTTFNDGAITNGEIALAQYNFKLTTGKKATNWKGSKELPADGSIIVAQAAPIMIQINPVDVDAKDVSFSLINSQNKTADITFDVKDYTGLFTGTRAANTNGLYDLTVEDQIFANTEAAKKYVGALADKGQLFAVTAGKIRSEYKVAYVQADAYQLSTYSLMDGNTEKGKANIGASLEVEGIELNKWYTVATNNESALYDMHLSVDNNDKVLFGIEFQQVDGKFQVCVTKTPDIVSKPYFDMKIETVDKNGNWESSKIRMNLSELISDAYVYDLTEYQLKDTEAKKNSFSVAATDMTSEFNAEQLALWNRNLDKMTFKVVDKDGKEVKNVDDLSLVLVDKDGNDYVIDDKKTFNAAAVKAAKTFSVRFNNTAALAEALALNTTYTIVLTCVDEKNREISTAKIPFTLSIPAIETFFVEQPGVFVDGVANAYMDIDKAASKTQAASYKFASAFNKFGSNMGETTFQFKMDNSSVIVNNKKSAALAAITGVTDGVVTADNVKDVAITLSDEGKDTNTGLQQGYKQELIVNVVNAKFANVWAYGKADAVNYTFKIKVMSPLYEGKIVAVNDKVSVDATKVNGSDITSDMITGYTYNDIQYSVLRDKKSGWTRKEVQSVKYKSLDTNVFTIKGATDGGYAQDNDNYTAATDKTPAKNATITVLPKNLAETTTAQMEVVLTDAWGYKLVQKIDVTVVLK